MELVILLSTEWIPKQKKKSYFMISSFSDCFALKSLFFHFLDCKLEILITYTVKSDIIKEYLYIYLQ